MLVCVPNGMPLTTRKAMVALSAAPMAMMAYHKA
jgi:hypothetical protein